MVYFSKLKLYGFKSFVDKTELEIGPGLNGIVGPNGCGKSNLVEALRWVMGEKSAKNMRGGGMEDVIFAGTSKRPARNMAEVTVVMNNEDATAPAPFDKATEIEINRRIEKDKGSQYRVNGKAVRARDVNLLFADTMTGASSPALVSQGRITEIISAKPADRRRILEESAGISGLHSRRHEAELRLRAAEQNMMRLNDSLGDMRSRLSSLKRQARQAERYKELSDSIRRLDLALSWGEWSKIHQKIKQDRASFAEYNDAVQSALETTKSLTTKVENLEKTLPEGRKNAMEAQAVLQNFRVSLERLEQDIQTKTKGLQDAVDAKAQLEKDNEFTNDQYHQVVTDLDAARTELGTLTTDGKILPQQITEAEKSLETVQSQHGKLTSEKQNIETSIAVSKETKANLESQAETYKSTLLKLTNNIRMLDEAIAETNGKIHSLKGELPDLADPTVLEDRISTLTNQIEKNQITLTEHKDKSTALQQEKDEISSHLTALQGELGGLETLVSRNDNANTPEGDEALFNQLNVNNGYEKAVSSALGQWIMMAGINDTASVYWSSTDAAITAPKDTIPLIEYVDAPKALHAYLSAVGYVDTLDTSAKLEAGQMIVAKDGAFKRWDGLIVKADAAEQTDQAGLILEQRNRIAQLEKDISSQEKALEKALKAFDNNKDALLALEETNNETVSEKSNLETELRDTLYQQERIKDQTSTLQEKLDDQTNRLKQNKDEQTEVQQQYDSLQTSLTESEAEQLTKHYSRIEELNVEIATVSQQMEETRQSLSDLRQAERNTAQKIQSLTAQIERYETEKDKLAARLDEFEKRQEEAETKIKAYKTTDDDDTDSMREELLSKIANQEDVLRDYQTSLETQEGEYKTLQSQLREAEASAATAREQRATAQANVSNAENDLHRLEEEIRDRFEITPQALEEQVFSLFDDQIPNLESLQNEKDTVVRQRDNIGPVNLRAAIECQETETQLAEMEAEYDDLTKAIEQLRGGIAKLNREAKERLAIAFQRVDQHFQRLFTKLFEGGHAYLEMIQSDDPLESGLEIFAQPPGKSCQKLSLLSGGEQTLTATALIFAMFLTNPSPICVLDEIDAPLDDANVDRVCSLMESIATDTDTRFIVITHHRMTMARMNRLYGVTMGERGVSQLVSVDLALQEELELAETA